MGFKRQIFHQQASAIVSSGFNLLGYSFVTVQGIGFNSGASAGLKLERSIDGVNFETAATISLVSGSQSAALGDKDVNWPFWRLKLDPVTSGQFNVWVFAQQRTN